MSVRKRGKRWVAKTWDPATGRQRWQGTFDTKADARRAELSGRKRGRSAETCDQFAARWTDDYPRPRESTNVHNRERVSKLAKDFNGRRLDSIERSEARAWALANPGRVGAVRAMFNDARLDGLIHENPFAGLRITQPKGRKDLDVVSEDTVWELAAAARRLHGPMYPAFLLTAAFVGMRPGELYALQWPSVDFNDDVIHVLASHSRSGGITTPKNHRTRSVALTPPAKEALALVPRTDPRVFLTKTGKPFTSQASHYYWNPVRNAVGLPNMAFYKLRHFCASYLLNTLELPAQDVAHQLGHTDGGTLVLKLYGHPSEGLARDRIRRAFGSNVHPLRGGTGAKREQTGGNGA